MPNIEITMPEIKTAARAVLARELTDAFAKATGFETEILAVTFLEYGKGMSAARGRSTSLRVFR